MKNISKNKPKVCPGCGGSRIASILYGLQGYKPKLEQAINDGRIVLGGCVLTDCDPAWQCVVCGAKIYKEEDIEALGYFTVDNNHDIPSFSEVCGYCKHLLNSGVDKECIAFPDGIPMDIWMGYDLHTERHQDQESDVVFEEKDLLF